MPFLKVVYHFCQRMIKMSYRTGFALFTKGRPFYLDIFVAIVSTNLFKLSFLTV